MDLSVMDDVNCIRQASDYDSTSLPAVHDLSSSKYCKHSIPDLTHIGTQQWCEG